MRVEIKGDIVFNDDKWIYDWFGYDCTCPRDIQDAINALEDGEALEVGVNSGGGYVQAGQEIYSLLRTCPTSKAVIEGIAGSAAGVAAMGAQHVSIHPVGMIMIHNVFAGGVAGDYHEMDKASNMLKQMNKAMSAAYVEKSGKPLDEVLKLMDKETWLTANQCLEYGFVDEILTSNPAYTNALYGIKITDDMRKQAAQEKAAKDAEALRRAEMKDMLLKDLEKYL